MHRPSTEVDTEAEPVAQPEGEYRPEGPNALGADPLHLFAELGKRVLRTGWPALHTLERASSVHERPACLERIVD
ncbi:MAG TPA: hypothetical protein VJT75_11570 [Thermoleophilaceae bacterium]|nr:hypothetical protein [Thermoleophilaceae bacterium]